jgi:hypothetical protein
MHRTPASTAKIASLVAVLGVAGILSAQWAPGAAPAPAGGGAASSTTTTMAAVTAGAAAAARSVASTTSAAAAVAATSPATPPVIRFATPAAATAVAFTSDAALRKQIKFETVKWEGEKVKTLDEESRLLLAQAAAAKAGLHQFGLSFEDVYGVIEAETSWIPRTGMGKNGVTSIGLAQFEPRTARGLGLKDPNDPVQAVMAAAVNMKHGAEWAAERLDDLELSPQEYQAKLREGVSVYYNLSVKGRNKWNGLNTAELPVETQRHIRNVRAGAAEANELAGKLLNT